MQISHDFFKKTAGNLIGKLNEREYGIGQIFFPSDNAKEKADFEKLITQADKAMYMHKEEYYEKSGLQRRL